MMFRRAVSIAGCLPLVKAAINKEESCCPPKGYNRIQNFNSKAFLQGTWYSVKQLEVRYQPAKQLYCVAATYTIIPSFKCRIFGCEDTQVDVYNRAREGVDGKQKSVHLVDT